MIPGNHDYGDPGSLWLTDHFQRENRELAPNLTVLLDAEPVLRDDAILLPCPLLQRQQLTDPTGWIRGLDFTAFDDRPRIVLAHGSTVNFQGEADDEDESTQVNFIDLDRLGDRLGELDYIALGDWHGFQQAGDKAWYAGSHETDRFPKSGQLTGQIADVRVTRAGAPEVEPVKTGVFDWFEHEETFVAADGPGKLDAYLQQRTAAGTAINSAVVKLRLVGHLGLEGHQELLAMLKTWRARFVDLRDEYNVALQPTASELNALTTRADDPLISGVARILVDEIDQGGEAGEVAAIALTLMYQQVGQLERSQ